MYPFSRVPSLAEGTADHPLPSGAAEVTAWLMRAVGDAFAVRADGTQALTITFLDSADARLREAGVEAMWLRGWRTLVGVDADGSVAEQTAPGAWPMLAASLTDGPVRDLVSDPLGVRALVPWAVGRVTGSGFAVLDDERKTVARLMWWTGSLTDPVARELPVRVQVWPLRGYEREARRVRRALTAEGMLVAAEGSWFAAVRDAAGSTNKPSERFGMRPDQSADLAVADALLGYLDDIEANVDGTVVGVDTEHLHELRVAVRRTRSVLKLVGDVLPSSLTARAADQFRWLGTLTTPTRDLDVYLLDMDSLAAALTRPEDLDPFAAFVRAQRANEQRALVRGLRSARFTELTRTWRGELAGVIAEPSTSAGTAAVLARERIRKAFAKAAKRAHAIDRTSPPEQVHALRKACKDVRYLLELFRPLCDRELYKKVLADFKAIQDVLGAFQDGEVQSVALRALAQDMLDANSVSASAILAMGELAAVFETTQQRARTDLDVHHDTYLGKRATAHLDRLVASIGRES